MSNTLINWMSLPQGFAPEQQRHWALSERLRTQPRFKRWIYMLLTAEEHQLGIAWVDLGYLTKVFAHLSLPGQPPERSLSAEVLQPGARPLRLQRDGWQIRAGGRGLWLELRQHGGQGLINLHSPKFSLSGSWNTPISESEILKATSPYPTSTRKSFAQPAQWRLDVQGQASRHQGLLGSDLSWGSPPRRTRWYWAYAQSPSIGFNLVEGFVGEPECALWRPGRLEHLAEGRFTKSDNQTEPWLVKTADDRLDLRFEEVSRYRDRTRAGVISSDFIQAYGYYSGKLREADGSLTPIERLPGVAEYQDSLW